MENKNDSNDSGLTAEIKGFIDDGLKSRFNDPIISTLFISFLVSNWDLLLLAFMGETPASERVSAIYDAFIFYGLKEPWYFNLNLLTIFHRVLLPISATFIFLFVWPRVFKIPLTTIEKNKVVRRNFAIEAQKDLINIKNEFEKVTRENLEQKEKIEALNREIGGITKERDQAMVREEDEKKIRIETERSLQKQKDEFAPLPSQDSPLTTPMNTLEKLLPSFKEDGFKLSIMEYTRKYHFTKEKVFKLYKDTLNDLFNEFASKHPQSVSIKSARNHLLNFLNGPSVVDHFEELLEKFKASEACDKEDEDKIAKMLSLKKHLENFIA